MRAGEGIKEPFIVFRLHRIWCYYLCSARDRLIHRRCPTKAWYMDGNRISIAQPTPGLLKPLCQQRFRCQAVLRSGPRPSNQPLPLCTADKMSPQPSKATKVTSYPQLSVGSGRTATNHQRFEVFKDRFAITKAWIYNCGSQTPSYYNFKEEPFPCNQDVPQAPIPSKPTSPSPSPPPSPSPVLKATRSQRPYSSRTQSL